MTPTSTHAGPPATAAATPSSSSSTSTSSSYYGASANTINDWSYPSKNGNNAAATTQSSHQQPAQQQQQQQYQATVPTPVGSSATSTPKAAGMVSAPSPSIMNPYMMGTNNNTTNSSMNGQSNNYAAPVPTPGLQGTMDSGAPTVASNMNNPSASSSAFASPYLSGPMDSATQPSTFIPNANATTTTNNSGAYTAPPNFDDEPPLLEELGINVEHIVAKTRAVVLPLQRFGGNMDATVIQDGDLVGPIALALLLGGELLFSAKMQFGAIYGFGMFGCVSMTLILNLMSPQKAVSVWTVTSILGYALLPVNVLALLKIFLVNLGRLQTLGRVLGVITVLWSTVASTRLMEQGCDMRAQRYLIAYPIALLYSAFVMITIF